MTKVREIEINSMACFRYDLPIYFTYLRNGNLSNVGDLTGEGGIKPELALKKDRSNKVA
jgi:hypothetical protein